jgi:hypothetical protein
VALLVTVHLATFWQHYFADHAFPWDFISSYFAMEAYNAAALAHGELPQWMPYQCMGYPYLLNPQTSLFYPPTWLFPLLGIRYTLDGSVVLQCLHVLFGAFGMHVFLRRRLDGRTALLGAVAYHFFGGFYSNASHPDIVRAFALLPWLFDSVTLEVGRGGALPRSALLLPLWLALLATGGYAGNVVSYSVTLAAYWVLQMAAASRAGTDRRELARLSLAVAVLAASGVAMAALRLGPGFMDRHELVRYSEIAHVERLDLSVDHWLGLFLSGQVVGGNGTMASTFVGVPIVMLVFLVGRGALEAYWPLAATAALSVGWGFGFGSPAWHALTALVPPAAYSRMGSSDWRAQAGFALIVFAMLGLRGISNPRPVAGLTLRLGLGSAIVLGGAWAAYDGLHSRQALVAALMTAATAGLLAVAARRPATSTAAWTGLLVLTATGAWPVLADMRRWWQLPEASAFYAREGWQLQVDGEPLPDALFEGAISMRPPRDPVGLERQPRHYREWLVWGGYLQGHFLMTELPRCRWRTARALLADPDLTAYMQREWLPLLLPPAAAGWDGTALTLPPGALSSAGSPTPGRGVQQVGHGRERIEYRVALAAPTLMVENEVYFRGWRARLDTRAGPRLIEALRASSGLRAWLLPSGEYRMHAYFDYPLLRPYGAISVVGLLAWLAAAVARYIGPEERL